MQSFSNEKKIGPKFIPTSPILAQKSFLIKNKFNSASSIDLLSPITLGNDKSEILSNLI